MRMSVKDEKPDLAVSDGRAPSVAHLFVDRVAATPRSEAFRYPVGEQWQSLTWQETDARVRDIAGGLAAAGVQLGDRVAIAAATSIEWVLGDLGVMLAGAATTTIYPTSTAEDYRYILADSGSCVLMAENAEQVAKIDRVRDQLLDNTERFARGLPANNALLWGARGMGKSSLVNILSGVTRPTSGRVTLGDADVTRLSSTRRAHRGLARSFQTSALFDGLTARENVRLAIQAAGTDLVYLQVERDNTPARILYTALGMEVHHEYAYLRPPR